MTQTVDNNGSASTQFKSVEEILAPGVSVNDVMAVLEERSHVKGNKKTVGHLDKTF